MFSASAFLIIYSGPVHIVKVSVITVGTRLIDFVDMRKQRVIENSIALNFTLNGNSPLYIILL